MVAQAEPGADLRHWPEIRDLLNTYCGYRLGPEDVILFEIEGTAYFMADIGLRMLTPRELYMANGFPQDYKIERDYTGPVYPKTKQVARCGNAVPAAVRHRPGAGQPAGVVRRRDQHHGGTGKGGGGIAAGKKRRKAHGRYRDRSGNRQNGADLQGQGRERHGAIDGQVGRGPTGGSVAIWPMDPEKMEPSGPAEVYGDWDAAAYLRRVVELIHPNRQINIPDLEAMIRAAERPGRIFAPTARTITAGAVS